MAYVRNLLKDLNAINNVEYTEIRKFSDLPIYKEYECISIEEVDTMTRDLEENKFRLVKKILLHMCDNRETMAVAPSDDGWNEEDSPVFLNTDNPDALSTAVGLTGHDEVRFTKAFKNDFKIYLPSAFGNSPQIDVLRKFFGPTNNRRHQLFIKLVDLCQYFANDVIIPIYQFYSREGLTNQTFQLDIDILNVSENFMKTISFENMPIKKM